MFAMIGLLFSEYIAPQYRDIAEMRTTATKLLAAEQFLGMGSCQLLHPKHYEAIFQASEQSIPTVDIDERDAMQPMSRIVRGGTGEPEE